MKRAVLQAVIPVFLDKFHGFGNKYYKLKYNLAEAKRKGCSRVITFGGAWSNSVHALAHIAAQQGFETVAVIRGERPLDPLRLSAMLVEVEALGMHLHFISRTDYRRRYQADFLEDLQQRFPHSYLLPEGGTNQLAVAGAREIVTDVDSIMQAQGDHYDVIALPVATGGTLAGIATALPAGKRVLGISVLKGSAEVQDGVVEGGLEADVRRLIAGPQAERNWRIEHRFHCGGYARCPKYLQEYIIDWEAEHGEQLDPVYTGKLFYGLAQMQQANEFSPGTRIVALHTGGLQGRRGFDF
jgi:1-aminocyclopropane-1-carboxylate deaminase/D-cysteine desulfhydrase-like pyridoxal-dependent ACC family enzyme